MLLLQILPTTVLAQNASPMIRYHEVPGQDVSAIDAGIQRSSQATQRQISEQTVRVSHPIAAQSSVSSLRLRRLRSRSIVMDSARHTSDSATKTYTVGASRRRCEGNRDSIRSLEVGSGLLPKKRLLQVRLPARPTLVQVQFSVREYFVADFGPSKLNPAYVVFYLQSQGSSWNLGPGLHCPAYSAYTVDADTFQVFLQPKIC